MITYTNCDIDISTTYSVEYIDNQKDMDYVNSGRVDKGEPWEKYKTKSFQDIDTALSLFMAMFVRSDILALRLFEETKVGGNTVREQYIEPAATTMYNMRCAVGRDMEEKMGRLERANAQLSDVVSTYRQFVSKYNSEKLFEQYEREAYKTAI